MKYAFGKNFTYEFTPLIDGELVKDIPAHTAKALIYSSQPSRSQVVNEEGAIATFSAEWAANGTSIEFNIGEIDDPQPDANNQEELYYIGIKFKVDSDEGFIAMILALRMVRVRGTQQALRITIDQVKAVYENVLEFFTPQAIQNQIATQITLLKADLKSRCYDWAMLTKPNELSMGVIHLALGALFTGDTISGGDNFITLGKYYNDIGDGFLKVVRVEYDNSIAAGANPSLVKPKGSIRTIR